MLIEDGRDGFTAKVDSTHRLAVRSVSEASETHVALEDELAFSVDTGILTFAAADTGPVVLLQNFDATKDIVVTDISIAFSVADVGTEVSLYRNPIIGTLGAEVAKKPININFESGKTDLAITSIWDGTGVVGITGITAAVDGVFGPFPAAGLSLEGIGVPFVLGQSDALTVNLTAGAITNGSVTVRYHYNVVGGV